MTLKLQEHNQPELHLPAEISDIPDSILNLWDGEGTTKIPSDLQDELDDGSCVLRKANTSLEKMFSNVVVEGNETINEGDVFRIAQVAVTNPFCNHPELGLLRMRERDRYYLYSKKIQERHKHMYGACAEKMKTGEDLEMALKRGMFEELGIYGFDLEIMDTETRVETKPAHVSFPKLVTVYNQYIALINLPLKLYKPYYYEYKSDRSGLKRITTFDWTNATEKESNIYYNLLNASN
mgnify:CR=1 FL=1